VNAAYGWPILPVPIHQGEWRRLFQDERWLVGSYTYNGWLGLPSSSPDASVIWGATNLYRGPELLLVEDQIWSPASTPVLGDGVWPYSYPRAQDLPATNLVTGDLPSGMSKYCIPRHGSRPIHVPVVQPSSAPLPGAINLGFFDGHAEQVPLERLWQLYWHRDYVPPARRPGLPP
jgi:prepilin-type processing-associated H-X9-DG protein